MAFRFLKRGLAGILIGMVLAAVLGGCNKLRLGYEYADWMVIYSVEDNFDLEKGQRARFKEGVESYFHWHRKVMLPLYADFLSSTADSLGKGLRQEGMDSGLRQAGILYRKTMEPTVEKAVDLLMSLTPAQVDQWHEKQQKKTLKLRKDFSGSREEQLERRYEKTVDELEDWTGRLGKEQKRQVRALSRALPWNGHLWLENREKVQARLAALLKSKAPREEVGRLIGDYFLFPERLRSKEYEARIRESEAKTRVMVARIYAILTPQQRRTFRTRMEKLAEDFRKMSRMD
jgi:Family of unknown function (DUF6279)